MSKSSFMPKGFNENTKIIILNHKEIRKDDLMGSIEITGKVKNNEKETWEHISVKAEYFNSKGEFTDVATGYINGKLKPNEESFFKIDFYCKENIGDYVNYKISVIDGMPDMYK